IGFSSMPLHLAVWLGVIAAAIGFLIALWAIWTKLSGHYSPTGWASTVAVVMFIGGVQLLMLGVIGEYLSRVYDEVRRRPLYLVKSKVGFLADNLENRDMKAVEPRI
ncbi:MAG: glycosyltransferase, partial [Blastocatellia bacterium]|nr:glycosyltransferase [Blastocatellia bacterium]